MRTFAEFQIIGRVGKTKVVGNTLRISIAAEYGRKDDKGEFQLVVGLQGEVPIQRRKARGKIQNVQTGDIVHARGTLRQTQWENNSGGTEYGMTLAAEDFDDFTHDERRRAAANNG